MPIAGLGAAPNRYAGPVSRLSVRPESRNHEFRDAATGIRHGIPPLWGFIHSGIGDLHALQKDRTEGPIQGEGSSFRSYWWVLASGGPWVCCVISGARKAAWADSLPARGLSSRPSRSRAPAKRCPASPNRTSCYGPEEGVRRFCPPSGLVFPKRSFTGDLPTPGDLPTTEVKGKEPQGSGGWVGTSPGRSTLRFETRWLCRRC
jgi:hypothetical protein